MLVYAFALGLALAGQVTADNRYGPPPTSPPRAEGGLDFGAPATPLTSENDGASASEVNPFSGSARSGVTPPPPVSQINPPPATPISPRTTTPSDYGLGGSRTTAPAATPHNGATTPSGLSPTAMMRAMLSPPNGAKLTGQPVSLVEVIAGAGSRSEQSQRIDAYWDLCSSVADYYLGLREQDELQRLRSMAPNAGPVWQPAQTELGVRIGTSQRAAVAAQYRLASLMGRGGASLPLPGDLPHCGDYYVRYDQIFAGRASPEAQQLSELLPLRYEELRDASTAVTRAEEWLATSARDRANADGTSMLRALELLALRRRAFVQIVRDYNRRITRYTELASPGEIGTDRLIGMLIKRDGAPSTATRPQSTSPPTYGRQTQMTPEVPAETPPRTFDDDWLPAAANIPADKNRDEEVEPASVHKPRTTEPREERSLLVPSSR